MLMYLMVMIINMTRRASLVSNSFFYYKTEGLRVKNKGGRLEVNDKS